MPRAVRFFLFVALIAGGVFAVYLGQVGREIEKEVTFEAPDFRQRRFDRAVEKIEAGDKQAWSDIDALAASEPTFLPAHQYIVDYLKTDQHRLSDPGSVAQLARHLIVLAQNDDVEAKLHLAKLYEKKNHVKSILYLREIVNVRYDAHAFLARMLMQHGSEEEGIALAEKTVEHFRRKIDQGDGNDEVRLLLAANLSLLGRNEEAVQALKQCVEQTPEVHDALMANYMAHFDSMINKRPTEAVLVLQDASQADPKHLPVWHRVLLATGSDDATAASHAQTFLDESIKRDHSGGAIELAQGIRARKQDQFGAAVEHLKRAIKKTPQLVEAKEHLAICLALAEPPDFDQSLEISNQLVSEHPSRIDLRADRGRILELMQRDAEATQDLEQAVGVMMVGQHADQKFLEPYVDALKRLYERSGRQQRAMALDELIQNRFNQPE